MKLLAPILLIIATLLGCRSTDELAGLKTNLFDAPEEFDLEFSGVRSFSSGLLQRAASEDFKDFVQGDFSELSIDDAAYTIENFYRARGFPFTEVAYSLNHPEGKRPKVKFSVKEGPRTRLAEVRFKGNRSVKAEDLESLIGGPTTQLFGLGDLYYVKAEAESARSAMEDLYYQRGHLEVRVEAPMITFDESRKEATVEYLISEGPRFSLTKIEVQELPKIEYHLPAHVIEERLASFKGRAYFSRLAYELSAAAADVLADRGYADAHATTEETIDRATGDVTLKIQIEPGELVRLSDVVIIGNEKTSDRFVHNIIEIQPGDVFRRSAERRAFRALYATGLFESVTFELIGKGKERALHVNLEEADTLSFFFEGGYGSYEGLRFLFGASEENLFGTGRSLRFQGKLAERARGATIFLRDPYTISSTSVLGSSFFVEERKMTSFDSLQYGFTVNLTRHLTDNYRNIYGYEYRISDSSNVDVVLPGIDPEFQESVNISALYLTNVYDTRDSYFMPTRGAWIRIRTELAPEALDSEFTFGKLDTRFVQYLPISETSRLAWTMRLGVIAPIEGWSTVPLQERYFNGGQNTVRSFREDELGPTDADGNEIGGEAFTVISAEYRHDLPGSFSGALFVDAGNVSPEYQDALKFADMRYAVGPGIRWLLPIGPLRLDWGINPNPRVNESDWVVQFSLGIAF